MDSLIKDEIEKDYEYKLDKREKKRSAKEAQLTNYWILLSQNN